MSLARAAGVVLWSSVLLACGAITGLDDYTESALTDGDGGLGSSSGTSGSSTSGSSTSSSSTSSSGSGNIDSGGSTSGGGDAAGDAPKDVVVADPCPKHPGETPPRKLNESTCTASTQCCSDACNEENKCKGGCEIGGAFNCNPFGADCCIGYYCTGNLPYRCSGCKLSGTPAETVAGTPIARSCCSKTLTGANCG